MGISRAAARTMVEMYQGGQHLKHITLSHKDHTFNFAHLITVVEMIKAEQVEVEIMRELTSDLGADALYVFPNKGTMYISETGITALIEGNKLYLPSLPSSSSYTQAALVHEAVHIHCDLVGKNANAWTNEEMAYFVDGFIYARLAPLQAKRAARIDNHYLIGCLASEFLDANSDTWVISSAQFNSTITFDYSADGGVKGKTNPYMALHNMVAKSYAQKKHKDYAFDGIG